MGALVCGSSARRKATNLVPACELAKRALSANKTRFARAFSRSPITAIAVADQLDCRLDSRKLGVGL